MGSRTGLQRFWLTFGGGPAGQADDFECRGDAAFGIGILRLIDLGRAQHHGATGGAAQAGGKRIAFAHQPQVAHQVQRVAVAHGFGKAVGHGQRKARTLQKPAQIADFAHGQHARRQAARHFGLCLGQTGAQFVQGLAAKHQTQKQTIRAQGMAGLDQLADRIIGPMQAERMDHQILRAGGQRQNVVIGNCRPHIAPDIGKTCHDSGCRKLPVNLGQSFLHFGAHFIMQEEFGRAAAIARQGVAVGQDGWRLHGAENGARLMGLQAALLHMVYPPQCVACDAMVSIDFGLCGACWRETPFVAGLVCDLCGTPLPGQDPGHAVHCDDCLTVARPWSRGRAAMLYRDRARDLVLQLKHADRLDLARPMGGWLMRAAQPILQPGMLVAPVPLHWMRLLRRRYNQSALLSAQVARLAGLAHCPDLLQRQRNTQSQEGRTRDGRFANLADSIRVHPRRRDRVEGRHVLLVDDVMTSGATLAAAAEACLAVGAAEITVLVLCRVAKEG